MNSHLVIVLVHPQLGENIGAVARVMANFGLRELRLVAPRDGWPNPAAEAMAAGAETILREARLCDTLEEALADCHCVYATTSRDRRVHKPVAEPRAALADIAARAREGQRVALVFGPERTGLDNDAVSLADRLLTIPVNPDYPSLNLAQAVGVCAYEWVMEKQKAVLSPALTLPSPALILTRKREGDSESSLLAGAKGTTVEEVGNPPPSRGREGWGDAPQTPHPPAPREELFGFFAHLEEALGEAGFYKTPEIKPNMDLNLRAMFQRADLTSQEISTLRGILRALTDPIQNPRRKSLKNKGKKSA